MADQTPAASLEMTELADGVAFWMSRRVWPPDFHNSDYERWDRENPHGTFTLEWWGPFLKTLQAWIATRPVSGDVLTARFEDTAAALEDTWQSSCEPYLAEDISTVAWEQVEAFPTLVATIKPTLTPSPVFTSKFCHFLLPRVFPVVDNEGLGNRWPTFESYFRFVQDQWAGTEPEVRQSLADTLTRLIEATSTTLFQGFPMTNKLVELRLMGRQHPGVTNARTLPSY